MDHKIGLAAKGCLLTQRVMHVGVGPPRERRHLQQGLRFTARQGHRISQLLLRIQAEPRHRFRLQLMQADLIVNQPFSSSKWRGPGVAVITHPPGRTTRASSPALQGA